MKLPKKSIGIRKNSKHEEDETLSFSIDLDEAGEETNDEPQYAEAQRLLELLRYFEPVSKDIVPSHSLLKEFLGGGDFKG